MAGQWEPVAGVFWRTPPAVADEGWPFLPVIIVLLVATFVSAAVGVRVAKKHKQPEWHLRQHMTEIGGAVTFVYLVGIAALTWGRTGTLLTMPLNEVGDFLAGAFGPVAFLWLVLGFLQQGDELRQGTKALDLQAIELRNSVQQQSIMASAALEQIDTQRTQLQMQHDERQKALRANFEIVTTSSGGLPKGMARNAISIWNEGAHATDLAITFEPQILGAHLLGLVDMRSDTRENYSFDFNPSMCADEGIAKISYLDTEGGIRHQSFAYTLDKAALRFDFKRIFERFS